MCQFSPDWLFEDFDLMLTDLILANLILSVQASEAHLQYGLHSTDLKANRPTNDRLLYLHV